MPRYKILPEINIEREKEKTKLIALEKSNRI